MSDWQKVYQDKQEYRAEIVRAVLEDRGFQPVLVNMKDFAYQFGDYEVKVSPEYVMRAIKVIKEEIRFE